MGDGKKYKSPNSSAGSPKQTTLIFGIVCGVEGGRRGEVGTNPISDGLYSTVDRVVWAGKTGAGCSAIEQRTVRSAIVLFASTRGRAVGETPISSPGKDRSAVNGGGGKCCPTQVTSESACRLACEIENEFLCRSFIYKGPPAGTAYNCELFHLDHKTLPDGPSTYLNAERPLIDDGQTIGNYYENYCESECARWASVVREPVFRDREWFSLVLNRYDPRSARLPPRPKRRRENSHRTRLFRTFVHLSSCHARVVSLSAAE